MESGRIFPKKYILVRCVLHASTMYHENKSECFVKIYHTWMDTGDEILGDVFPKQKKTGS